MGSPPPLGATKGARVDKRYFLGESIQTIDAQKQKLFREYLVDLEKLRECYKLKGLEIEFDTATGNDWSMRLTRSKATRRRRAGKRKRK
jgi:hypothetical protein